MDQYAVGEYASPPVKAGVDRQVGIQLSTPKLGFNTAGYSIITKKTMKARGMKSPDRAEAVLLSVYEPEPLNQPRRRGLLN